MKGKHQGFKSGRPPVRARRINWYPQSQHGCQEVQSDGPVGSRLTVRGTGDAPRSIAPFAMMPSKQSGLCGTRVGRLKRRVGEMAKRRTPKHSSPKGYDFGLSGLTALVASPQFIEELRNAEVIAWAYGWEHSTILQEDVPLISLGARKEDPLKRAFDEFYRWQQESHDDGVSLSFVFLDAGGYLMCISTHSESLSRRLGRSASPSDRLFVAPMFIKMFDTRDRWLDHFREYRRQRVIAPFHFGPSAVTLTGPQSIDRSTVRFLIGARTLLKFQVDIADETEAASKPGTMAWIALNVQRKERFKDQSPNRASVRETRERREELLKRHFPVTLERIRLFEPYRQMTALFEKAGVRRWQLQQAVCNLLLSKSLCDGVYHYATIRTGHLASHIAAALRERVEEADGKRIFTPGITSDNVSVQVRLDGAVLLKSQGVSVSPDNDLSRIQSALASRGLLDA